MSNDTIRGRVKLFYADGTTAVAQVTASDRIRASREKAKANEDEAVWFTLFLAASRAQLPHVATFEEFTASVVDQSPIYTPEQIDLITASDDFNESEREAMVRMYEESKDVTPGEVRGPALRGSSPASPSAPVSHPASS